MLESGKQANLGSGESELCTHLEESDNSLLAIATYVWFKISYRLYFYWKEWMKSLHVTITYRHSGTRRIVAKYNCRSLRPSGKELATVAVKEILASQSSKFQKKFSTRM